MHFHWWADSVYKIINCDVHLSVSVCVCAIIYSIFQRSSLPSASLSGKCGFGPPKSINSPSTIFFVGPIPPFFLEAPAIFFFFSLGPSPKKYVWCPKELIFVDLLKYILTPPNFPFLCLLFFFEPPTHFIYPHHFYHGLLPERQINGHGAFCFMRGDLTSERLG